MRVKKAVIAIIAIVIVGGAIGGYFLLRSQQPVATDTSNSMDMSSNTGTSNNTAPTATNSVTIQNFAFSPASITVKKGTTVTWTNSDSVTHTVTEDDGQSGPDSGDVNPGSSYSFTFNATGTYRYHCAIHPSMLGTVTVTD